MQDILTFEELIGMRNALMVNQQRIYITAISNINMRYSELLKNDFGSTLVRNCAWDIADTLVTEYFDTGDFYISPQQVYDRIVHLTIKTILSFTMMPLEKLYIVAETARRQFVKLQAPVRRPKRNFSKSKQMPKAAKTTLTKRKLLLEKMRMKNVS